MFTMLRTLASPVVCLSVLLTAGLAAERGVREQEVVRQTMQVGGPGGDGMPLQKLPPGRQAKTGTSRLRGRIVATDTGSAVRRAQVRISGPEIGTKTALTDAQGRYEF